MLLKRDKKRQQPQWLSYKRSQSANHTVEYLSETGNIKELPYQKVKWKSQAIDNFTTKLGSKPSTKTSTMLRAKTSTNVKTKLESKSNAKNSTKLGSKPSIKTSTKLGSKTGAKTDSISIAIPPIITVTASSVFEPLYHNVGEEMINISNTCTGQLQNCYGNAHTNDIVLVKSSVINQDQGRQGWYKQLYHYDLSMSSADVFEEELVVIVIPDYATVMHSNVLDIFQLEDPKIIKLYDVPRAQLYGGAKCKVTKNLNLLCKVK